SGKGLVVVTFSQPYDETRWFYRDLAGARAHSSGDNDHFINTALVRGGETILYPFELPAGEYEFFRWTGPEIPNSRLAPVAWADTSVDAFSIKFRSVADQVTYIGNLQLDYVSDGTFRLSVHDMHETDIAEFTKTYPNIRIGFRKLCNVGFMHVVHAESERAVGYVIELKIPDIGHLIGDRPELD